MNKTIKYQIEDLEKLIKHHRELMEKAKATPVKIINNDGISDSYDKRTFEIEESNVRKYTYELIRLKCDNLWFPRKTKELESAWNLYLSSLNNEMVYLKSQKTKKYIDEKSNSPIWKADQIEVSKLLKYINDVQYAYDSWSEKNTLSFQKLCADAYKNPLFKILFYILVTFSFFGFIPYIINEVVVSKPPFDIAVAQDNDWIGFWSTYIAGTLGAFIGGFIAYLISIYQFKKQRQLSKEDRILSLVMENVPEIISSLNQLTYLINLDSAYLTMLLKLDSDYINKEYDEYFKSESSKFLNLIQIGRAHV